MDILILVIGLLIVASILVDAFHTIIVPRPITSPFHLGTYLVDKIWYLWRWATLHILPSQRQEWWLAMFAPLMVIFILLFWLVGMIFGFGLIFYVFRSDLQPSPPDLSSALYFAGTSLLTIGFGDVVATTGLARLIVLCDGAFGLAILSGAISLIFFLYSFLHHRDILVSTLDIRAGSPPSGLALLETYARLTMLPELHLYLTRWEEWATEVQMSSISYSVLVYFRSPVKNESWLNAFAAVLDAATLLLSCTEKIAYGQAYLMYQRGQQLLLTIDRHFHITPPSPDLQAERLLYEKVRASLGEAGYPLRETEAAWLSFLELRSGYASALRELARHLAIQLSVQ